MGRIWMFVHMRYLIPLHVYAINERSSYQGNGDAKKINTYVSSSLSFSREI